MQPRYYSISPSAATSPKSLSVTVSITHGTLSNGEPVEGLASSCLHALHRQISALTASETLSHATAGPNDMLANAGLFAQIRKSKFKLPALGSHPIVMVANGTGIAPFRAFIAERYRLAKLGKPIGKMLLIFGCRGEENFLYREEFENWQRELNAEELKFTIVEAFSRQAEKRCYVQKRVRECYEDICQMLEGQRANFYLCGSAIMAREVGKSVEDAFRSIKGWDSGEWNQWNDQQRRTNKWQEDVWG